MEDFRAKPVTVPEDWYFQMVKLKKKVSDKYSALADEIGRKQAAHQQDSESCTLYKDDLLKYFETALSVPEVRTVQEGLFHFHEKEPWAPSPEEWGKLQADFLRWWVYSKLDVNYRTASWVVLKYQTATSEAWKEVFRSGDIAKAYKYLQSGAEKRDFTDGGLS